MQFENLVLKLWIIIKKLKNLLNDFDEKFKELWKLKISIVFLLNFFEIDIILLFFKNLFSEIAEKKNKINRIA